MECEFIEQGCEQGSCQVFDFTTGREQTVCKARLKYERGIPYRLINAILLSRPEHYLSVYQSGCNLRCKKDERCPASGSTADDRCLYCYKGAGLRKIKFGDVHLFLKTREEYEILEKIAGDESF